MTKLLLVMNAKKKKKAKQKPTPFFYSSMKNNKQITELGNYLSNVLACCSQKPKITLDEMPA